MKNFYAHIALALALSITLNQGLIAQDLQGEISPATQKHAALNSRPLSEEKKNEMEEMRAKEFEAIQKEESAQTSPHLSQLAKARHQTAASIFPLHCHVIANFLSGNTIELEDESKWSVNTNDYYIFRNWRVNDVVVISPKVNWFGFSNYAYVMTNKNIGTSVDINPFDGPLVFGPHTRWIVGMDYNQGHVYLINGLGERSTWMISSKDMYLFRNWKINDAVIIGDSDEHIGWWFSYYHHILINVEMNHYVHARTL